MEVRGGKVYSDFTQSQGCGSCWKFLFELGPAGWGTAAPSVPALSPLRFDESLILYFQITEQARVLLW